MKRLVISVGLVALLAVAHADSLQCAGVLGNSGEQGDTLVRFGEKTASGMGVVFDKFGSLWDRAGDGVLNRYAPDGRLLASYRIAPSGSMQERDTLVQLGDTLLFKVGKKLYTLPLTATPDVKPAALAVAATRLSFNTHDGWAAAADDRKVFLINAKGETRAVTEADDNVDDIELGTAGAVYVSTKGKLRRVDAAAPATGHGPWPSPGERPQWLAEHWFGSAWHGTIRRFSPALTPDPGVVLGGGSGSFIGYVEGNHELNNGRGLAHLGGNLYAVSGIEGILHLLEWLPEDNRFKIIRRIGAVPSCNGLAMDRKGRVWYYSGVWEWNDGPDAPLQHSVPPAEGAGIFGAVMLENDVMVAPAIRWGKKALYAGKLDGPAATHMDVEPLPRDVATCALVTWEKRQALIVLNKTGKGVALYIGADGKYQSQAGVVELQTSVPLRELTSLAASGKDGLVGAADGQIIEFARAGNNWKETHRWNSWGDDPAARLGGKIFLAADQNCLWVSDTARQRVVCLNQSTRKPIATFGAVDKAGNNLSMLNAPQILTVNGSRAVVFDSGNQRLMKLELQTP